MREKTRKSGKICLVCGKEFLGTAAAQVCGVSCRTFLHRTLKAGKTPSFYIIAKSKGQRVPLIGVAKLMKEEKKKDELPKNEEPKKQELPIEPISELNKEQISAQISRLNKEIDVINHEYMPAGKLPKAWALGKSMRIDEIQDKINELKSKLK
jgi:hypothetical protein